MTAQLDCIRGVWEMSISKAIVFARQKHHGQLDDMGKPYFETHVMQVFYILKNITKDYEVLCAALLHDTLEDTNTTYEELKLEFGKNIADLVNEVTHDGSADEKGYYFPRLKSQNGILIKFADRLSNLSRMENWNQKRKDQYLKKSKFWKDS